MFACGVSTTAPHESVKVVGVNVPIQVRSQYLKRSVEPGDYVVADLDGIVVIPKGLVEKMIPLIQPQVSADEQMQEAIKAGMSFMEASQKFRT